MAKGDFAAILAQSLPKSKASHFLIYYWILDLDNYIKPPVKAWIQLPRPRCKGSPPQAGPASSSMPSDLQFGLLTSWKSSFLFQSVDTKPVRKRDDRMMLNDQNGNPRLPKWVTQWYRSAIDVHHISADVQNLTVGWGISIKHILNDYRIFQ